MKWTTMLIAAAATVLLVASAHAAECPTVGTCMADEPYDPCCCSGQIKCEMNAGDCDSDSQCVDDLVCGSTGGCPYDDPPHAVVNAWKYANCCTDCDGATAEQVKTTCTDSSSEFNANYVCTNAENGLTCGGDWCEWSTLGDSQDAWAEFAFGGGSYIVDRVRIMQRSNQLEQMAEARLDFFIGSTTTPVGTQQITLTQNTATSLTGDAVWDVFTMSGTARTASTSMKFIAETANNRNSNTGLREVEVYGCLQTASAEEL